MRILRNILLFFIPVVLIVNVTKYFFVPSSNFEFVGIHWVFDKISTFNGLGHTVESIRAISIYANQFASTDISGLDAVINGFKMIFFFFAIPITFIIDIILDLIWIMSFMWQ